MQPNFEPRQSPTPSPQPVKPSLPPPVPNPLRQDHSMPFGEQHSVDINNLPKNAGNNLFQSGSPGGAPTSPDYDFMLNPSPPSQAKMQLRLPGSTLAKAGVALGGLIVIIILFSIISSLFKGSSNLPYFTSVLEDQQELIHITHIAANATDISSNNQTFISTASVSLGSNSTQLQSYLASNGDKIDSSTLALKISKSTDTELSNAENAGNFNPTFDQVAKSQLNNYMQDLKLAYSKTTGRHGRALLSSLYNQANLLVVSLSNGT